MTRRGRRGGSGTFRSLRNRNFRLWLAGQAVSQTGFWVHMVGHALLVLDLTSSGSLLGVATAMQYLPIVVFGPWAGVLADRLDKRELLVATQGAMMISSLVLAILVLAGWITIASLLTLAAFSGAAAAFDQPPRRTFVMELVEDADAPNAMSLNDSANHIGKVVGPAIAGLLATTVGVGWCFVLNAASSVGVLVGLLSMSVDSIRRTPPVARAKGQITEAFAYVWSERTVRLELVTLALVAVVAFNWNVLLPLLVTRDLDSSEAVFTVVMGVMSVGTVAGALAMARRSYHDDQRFLGWGYVVFAIVTLAVAAVPNVVVLGLAAFCLGAGSMVLFNSTVVGLQVRAPSAMRGRVMSVFVMIFLGSYGIGGPLAGGLADRFGARTAFAVGAATAFAAGMAVLAISRRGERRLPTRANRWVQ